LIQQNIKNRLEIKNTMQDCGNHYLVKLSGGKNFLVDKIDLHFIEGHIWHCDNNYVVTQQNKMQVEPEEPEADYEFQEDSDAD